MKQSDWLEVKATRKPAVLQKLPLLVVEIVSTNWEDDYIDKLDEYQSLGVPEYWIVDYLAISPRQIIGEPKVPTISVYCLTSGQYQSNSLKFPSVFPLGSFTQSRRFVAQHWQ